MHEAKIHLSQSSFLTYRHYEGKILSLNEQDGYDERKQRSEKKLNQKKNI